MPTDVPRERAPAILPKPRFNLIKIIYLPTRLPESWQGLSDYELGNFSPVSKCERWFFDESPALPGSIAGRNPVDVPARVIRDIYFTGYIPGERGDQNRPSTVKTEALAAHWTNWSFFRQNNAPNSSSRKITKQVSTPQG